MQVDTAVFEALTERVDQLDRRLTEALRAEAIIARATAFGPALYGEARRVGKHAAPKRDRHGLRLVRGGDR